MSVIEERIWVVVTLLVAILSLSINLLRPVGISRIRTFLSTPITMPVVHILRYIVAVTYLFWSIICFFYPWGYLGNLIGFTVAMLVMGILWILAGR